ncbi:cytochrome c [Paraburkholderia sediminicola]|uniref:cytochrome c n=1 Tax=Paraburkholderia sediminicola TaxID=458836 RepID=UPI0038B8DD56
MNKLDNSSVQEPVWSGIVLRRQNSDRDRAQFDSFRTPVIDESELAFISSSYRLVNEAGVLGIVASTAEIRDKVVRSLKISWPESAQILQGSRPPVEREFIYRWPSTSESSVEEYDGPVAHWNGERLVIWTGCEQRFKLRREVSELLGLDESLIELRQSALYAYDDDFEASIDAATLARYVSVPISVRTNRRRSSNNFEVTYSSRGSAAPGGWYVNPNFVLSTPVQSNRTVLTASSNTASTQGVSGSASDHIIYDGNFDVRPVEGARVWHGTTSGRAAAVASAFARESFVDELARSEGADPVDWRLRNLSDNTGRDVIAEVVSRANWTVKPTTTSFSGKGRGFAYASTLDFSEDVPKRAWSAWVVDLSVDASDGRVSIDRITVGHNIKGTEAAEAVDDALNRQIANAAHQLLPTPQSFDEWHSDALGESQLNSVAQSVDVAGPTSIERVTLDSLSISQAMTLPAAAAVANAIFDATGVRLREPPFTGSVLRESLLARQEKRTKRGIAWIGAAISAVTGVVAMCSPWHASIPSTTPDLSLYSAQAIERGRLIAAASDCVVCHTAPGGKPNAGGLALDTPFGKIYSTNITPDPETGIGRWSFAAFDRAMRHGISKDGRHLYPAFPYTSFAKFSDTDMQALYAYLMSQPPLPSENKTTKLSFPYNIRPLMASWNLLFHEDKPFAPDQQYSPVWNRGAYLVQGAGHCGACHTPRNTFGAEKPGLASFLGGARVDNWEAPALNAFSTAPLPWTETDMFEYLRTGFSARHGVAAGPMAPVITGLQELPDSDIRAMAFYLTHQKGQATAQEAREPSKAATDSSLSTPTTDQADVHLMPGRSIYQGACAACHDATHGTQMYGVKPLLGLNTSITSRYPDNLIHVILNGISDPATRDLGYMPGFAESLDDDQITELVTYLRVEFGHGAPAWSDVKERVAQLRHNAHSNVLAETQ